MAQPDFAAVANHLQGIQNEVALVPNMPVAGLGALQQQMNTNHLQVMALLGEMQGQAGQMQGQIGQMQGQIGEMQGQIGEMQGQIGQMQGQIGQIQNEQQLLPMRLYNASASDTAPLRYPAAVPQGLPLPHTRRDLFELTSNQCQAVSALLGLPALPAGVPVMQRRQQIAEYIGVTY